MDFDRLAKDILAKGFFNEFPVPGHTDFSDAEAVIGADDGCDVFKSASFAVGVGGNFEHAKIAANALMGDIRSSFYWERKATLRMRRPKIAEPNKLLISAYNFNAPNGAPLMLTFRPTHDGIIGEFTALWRVIPILDSLLVDPLDTIRAKYQQVRAELAGIQREMIEAIRAGQQVTQAQSQCSHDFIVSQYSGRTWCRKCGTDKA